MKGVIILSILFYSSISLFGQTGIITKIKASNHDYHYDGTFYTYDQLETYFRPYSKVHKTYKTAKSDLAAARIFGLFCFGAAGSVAMVGLFRDKDKHCDFVCDGEVLIGFALASVLPITGTLAVRYSKAGRRNQRKSIQQFNEIFLIEELKISSILDYKMEIINNGLGLGMRFTF